jgi:hypothetical protein
MTGGNKVRCPRPHLFLSLARRSFSPCPADKQQVTPEPAEDEVDTDERRQLRYLKQTVQPYVERRLIEREKSGAKVTYVRELSYFAAMPGLTRLHPKGQLVETARRGRTLMAGRSSGLYKCVKILLLSQSCTDNRCRVVDQGAGENSLVNVITDSRSFVAPLFKETKLKLYAHLSL